MWKWIRRQSGAALSLVLLIAAGLLILVALRGSNKLKALAVVDLSPL